MADPKKIPEQGHAKKETCFFAWFSVFSCRDNTILAGTVRQPGRYDRTITEEDRREVLHRIYKLHPTLKSHKIKNEWCGLRPCRDSVRLERQSRKSVKGKSFEVLHNYGHGSNGFTLSWGCAQEVLGLLNQILSENRVDTPSKL